MHKSIPVIFNMELFEVTDGKKGDRIGVISGRASKQQIDEAIDYLLKLKEQAHESN